MAQTDGDGYISEGEMSILHGSGMSIFDTNPNQIEELHQETAIEPYHGEVERHHMVTTRARDVIHKPKKYLVEYQMFLVVKSDTPIEPNSIQEALSSKPWLTAMREELDAVKINRT